MTAKKNPQTNKYARFIAKLIIFFLWDKGSIHLFNCQIPRNSSGPRAARTFEFQFFSARFGKKKPM